MIPKPTLAGLRVTLRPLHPEDIDAYFALLTEDTEALRLTGSQLTFTREDIERWLAGLSEKGDRIDLAVTLRESRELIGEVVINFIDALNRSANIRILIRKPYTDRGYGSEAMRLMIAHAFEQLHLHRLELEVYAFNPRAIHVYEKLGFCQEGRRRGILYLEGIHHDAIPMGLLEDEYRARKATGGSGEGAHA